MRLDKEFSSSFLRTMRLGEDEMVERVWAKAPPGSKLSIHAFRVVVLTPETGFPVELFSCAHLTGDWHKLLMEDEWEFTQRLCELAYGRRDLFTEP